MKEHGPELQQHNFGEEDRKTGFMKPKMISCLQCCPETTYTHTHTHSSTVSVTHYLGACSFDRTGCVCFLSAEPDVNTHFSVLLSSLLPSSQLCHILLRYTQL